MTRYRIKYKIGSGYFVQYRDWSSYWTWMDVGNYHGDNFHIKFYKTLMEAQDKVKQFFSEKRQERTVYLYKR